MHTVCSSDSSESSYVSENEVKSKKKAKAKKINERFLDEFNDNYLQFLSCHHGSSSNSIQGENAEIFCSSVNGGKRKRGRPPKNKIEVISFDSEADKDSIGEFGKSENGGGRKGGMLSHFEDINDGDELYLEWLRSHGLSSGCGSAGKRKRGRPLKGMNVGVGSEPKIDSHRQRGRLPKNGGYGKRGRPPKNWKKGFDSERCCRRSRRLQTMSRK
ncbi:uncharacterized protein LOC141605318 [Silene latifolia]|uniref:uncharacterized protein LOC141605318 n=1 Tax=Silene latifolia TaxID=37657 RepID=UPI003D7851E3